MGIDKKLLFGIDDSDFSRQALAEAGALQKNSPNFKITIFHGAGDPNFPFMTKMLKLSPDELEKYHQLLSLEGKSILKKAEEALTESGFDPKKVTTIFEKGCNDPSESMMKLAGSQGFETVALARWGARTLSRRFMGSVTYRLINMADISAVWIMDPRVRSHDVLVTLVGAQVSHRVMEYTLRYFAHLKESRFTFFHVVPAPPPQIWNYGCIGDKDIFQEQQEKIRRWLEEKTDKVTQIADEGRQRLITAGIPEQNITLKLKPQEQGIARDILKELETGNYGIILIGRKGSKNIREFQLGSKANKLIYSAHTLITCIIR
jgi:nucleotide-binding universal stress UspA family protein